jgi:hypothetical protein
MTILYKIFRVITGTLAFLIVAVCFFWTAISSPEFYRFAVVLFLVAAAYRFFVG